MKFLLFFVTMFAGGIYFSNWVFSLLPNYTMVIADGNGMTTVGEYLGYPGCQSRAFELLRRDGSQHLSVYCVRKN